jgi:hypothetical protein
MAATKETQADAIDLEADKAPENVDGLAETKVQPEGLPICCLEEVPAETDDALIATDEILSGAFKEGIDETKIRAGAGDESVSGDAPTDTEEALGEAAASQDSSGNGNVLLEDEAPVVIQAITLETDGRKSAEPVVIEPAQASETPYASEILEDEAPVLIPAIRLEAEKELRAPFGARPAEASDEAALTGRADDYSLPRYEDIIHSTEHYANARMPEDSLNLSNWLEEPLLCEAVYKEDQKAAKKPKNFFQRLFGFFKKKPARR